MALCRDRCRCRCRVRYRVWPTLDRAGAPLRFNTMSQLPGTYMYLQMVISGEGAAAGVSRVVGASECRRGGAADAGAVLTRVGLRRSKSVSYHTEHTQNQTWRTSCRIVGLLRACASDVIPHRNAPLCCATIRRPRYTSGSVTALILRQQHAHTWHLWQPRPQLARASSPTPTHP